MPKQIPFKLPMLALSASLLFASVAAAVTPGPEAIRQWNAYRLHVQSELQSSFHTPSRFLWVDQSLERKAAVQSGNIVVSPMHNTGYIAVPSGLIHHWVGAIYLSETTAAQLVGSLQDYLHYSSIYSPAVTKSRLLTRNDEDFTYALTIVSKTLTFRTGLRGEFRSRFVSNSDGTGYSISESTELREVDDPDGRHERDLSPDQDHGYVQRILTVVRYREESEGTFVEVESVTLSRDIPSPIRWIAGPIVEKVSRESMAAILDKLKATLQPWSARSVANSKERTSLRRGFR